MSLQRCFLCKCEVTLSSEYDLGFVRIQNEGVFDWLEHVLKQGKVRFKIPKLERVRGAAGMGVQYLAGNDLIIPILPFSFKP
jgi:hypothetical protein